MCGAAPGISSVQSSSSTYKPQKLCPANPAKKKETTQRSTFIKNDFKYFPRLYAAVRVSTRSITAYVYYVRAVLIEQLFSNFSSFFLQEKQAFFLQEKQAKQVTIPKIGNLKEYKIFGRLRIPIFDFFFCKIWKYEKLREKKIWKFRQSVLR